MRCKWLTVSLLLVTFVETGTLGGATQNEKDKSLFLVARRDLSDLLFKESVVLMLPATDTDLVVGLIVNKPTRIPLREVFPKDSVLKDRTDAVYFGGPVDIQKPGILFLSSKSVEPAVHLAGDLYVSFDPDFIEGILVKPNDEVREVRLFLGRAQWSLAQLRGEMIGGAWYSKPEENTWIFRRDPKNVWTVLIGQLEADAPI
jgi:putative transcriptional regulator